MKFKRLENFTKRQITNILWAFGLVFLLAVVFVGSRVYIDWQDARFNQAFLEVYGDTPEEINKQKPADEEIKDHKDYINTCSVSRTFSQKVDEGWLIMAGDKGTYDDISCVHVDADGIHVCVATGQVATLGSGYSTNIVEACAQTGYISGSFFGVVDTHGYYRCLHVQKSKLLDDEYMRKSMLATKVGDFYVWMTGTNEYDAKDIRDEVKVDESGTCPLNCKVSVE